MVMAVTVAVCMHVLFGNNALPLRPAVNFDGKIPAVVGKDVRSPNQWPDDDQSPSYTQERGLAHFSVNDSQFISQGTPEFARGDSKIDDQPWVGSALATTFRFLPGTFVLHV